MTTSGTRQEQRVVTQEVRATSTVLANDSQVTFIKENLFADYQYAKPLLEPHIKGIASQWT